jgi:hypothetical protein
LRCQSERFVFQITSAKEMSGRQWNLFPFQFTPKHLRVQSEISKREKKMKNIKLCLFVLTLVCMVCLFAPCNTLAQDIGVVRCCYNTPPAQDPLNDNTASIFERSNKSMAMDAQFLDNPARTFTPVPMSAMTLAGTRKAVEMPAVGELRKLNYERQS